MKKKKLTTASATTLPFLTFEGLVVSFGASGTATKTMILLPGLDLLKLSATVLS